MVFGAIEYVRPYLELWLKGTLSRDFLSFRLFMHPKNDQNKQLKIYSYLIKRFKYFLAVDFQQTVASDAQLSF